MSKYEVRRTINGRVELSVIEAVDDWDALRLADLLHRGGTTKVWEDMREVGEISRESPHPIVPQDTRNSRRVTASEEKHPMSAKERHLVAKALAIAIVQAQNGETSVGIWQVAEMERILCTLVESDEERRWFLTLAEKIVVGPSEQIAAC